MPQNDTENRIRFPELAGDGHPNLHERPEFLRRTGMGDAMRKKIFARFARHPLVLFAYTKNNNGNMQWRPVCSDINCTNVVNDVGFNKWNVRRCMQHSHVYFRGHRIINTVVQRVHAEKRLVAAEKTNGGSLVWYAQCIQLDCLGTVNISQASGRRHQTCPQCLTLTQRSPKRENSLAPPTRKTEADMIDSDTPEWAKIVCYIRDTRGRWIPQRQCRNVNCGRMVRHKKRWWKHVEQSLDCRSCRTRYTIAGVQCNSKLLYADRDLISEWNYDVGGKLVPYCKCMRPGCDNSVRWSSMWSARAKQRIFCSSCGKVGREHMRPHEAAYNRLIKSAIARRLAMELSYVQFSQLCKIRTCTYCKSSIDRTVRSRDGKQKDVLASYLDRKNAASGYTIDNVVVCCGLCNVTKNKWLSFEEMSILGAIRQNLPRKAADMIVEHGLKLQNHARKLNKEKLQRRKSVSKDDVRKD